MRILAASLLALSLSIAPLAAQTKPAHPAKVKKNKIKIRKQKQKQKRKAKSKSGAN